MSDRFSMASTDDRTAKAQGEAAYRAIRKHFPSLMKVVATGDIVETLYAEEIVEESTFEVVTTTNSNLSSKQKGTKILKDVQIAVESKSYAFETFCRVLKQEGQAELSCQLQGRLYRLRP